MWLSMTSVLMTRLNWDQIFAPKLVIAIYIFLFNLCALTQVVTKCRSFNFKVNFHCQRLPKSFYPNPKYFLGFGFESRLQRIRDLASD